MTDEEIIEALQGCLHNDWYNKKCSECSFDDATSQCMDDLKGSVIELIDRHKAKIKKRESDKLNAAIEYCCDRIEENYEGLGDQFYQIARWLEELAVLREESKETATK